MAIGTEILEIYNNSWVYISFFECIVCTYIYIYNLIVYTEKVLVRGAGTKGPLGSIDSTGSLVHTCNEN